MVRVRVGGVGLSVIMCGLLLSPVASAQQAAASGIAGVVKDASGAVLPGVTVEAASPVLIEKIRAVSTDENGGYRLVDLRPGVYRVTFLIGPDGRIKKIWPEVKPEEHPAEVLAALK